MRRRRNRVIAGTFGATLAAAINRASRVPRGRFRLSSLVAPKRRSAREILRAHPAIFRVDHRARGNHRRSGTS
jgi:hypothetical protein